MRGSLPSFCLTLSLVAGAGTAGLALPRVAHAADGTEIASAMDEGDPFDIYIGVDYAFEAKRAAIKREFAGPQNGVVDGPMPIVKDLLYTENRHVITPHVQIGLFHDLELNLELPIVVNDTRSYDFDQRLGSNCIFSGQDANCVNLANSTTFRDGILPMSGGSFGYDAADPTTNFVSGKTVFKGVSRAGLDQIHVGLAWMPLNQDRDDTKPSWSIAAQFRFPIGKPMRFNRMSPSSEDGVGRGISEVRLSTSVSKRLTWAEPFVTFWWLAPLPMSGSKPGLKPDTQYWDAGFGQDSIYPQQQAGAVFGFNGFTWQNPKQKQFLAIEVRAKAIAHFQGRGYGEMWELFALGGDVTTNASAPLAIDPDPTSTTDAALPHPGVTTIENFMTFGGRLGLRGQMGPNAKFNASFELNYDQKHLISFDDAGKDLPTCKSGPATGCEVSSNDRVDPGTAEVNPLFKRAIDLPGRRYLVDESITYVFMLSGTLMF